MTEQHQNLSYSILSMMIDEYFQTLTTFPPHQFQHQTIAKILKRQDILLRAPTGSGKTETAKIVTTSSGWQLWE
ncbi:DEAD/DEAH box helicase [Nostoc sp. CHAB 5715]|uniref:DEAD/DEAH box helicase n=1 Tax=Nostoc sp. CHAB 5715 TaxID=2780400 RepID=UPI001E36EADB|nr:DEAD/DEAH box helicase [Nostoc sp. CHAB 5715]MCC5623904.1 DEAD/DEAH box helicase [Nostoc sp. CHAB 5715]